MTLGGLLSGVATSTTAAVELELVEVVRSAGGCFVTHTGLAGSEGCRGMVDFLIVACPSTAVESLSRSLPLPLEVDAPPLSLPLALRLSLPVRFPLDPASLTPALPLVTLLELSEWLVEWLVLLTAGAADPSPPPVPTDDAGPRKLDELAVLLVLADPVLKLLALPAAE